MHLLILGVFVAVVHSQTIDPKWEAFLGTLPPVAPESATHGFEHATEETTERPLVSVDTEGQACKCLPYYHCNSSYVAVDLYNSSVTGFKRMDVRSLDNDCTESQEVCCTIPQDIERKPRKPKSDPEKIKGCGYRNPEGIGAYFYGPTTQFGEFPWLVALLNVENGSYIGVGVLIHPQVVMTAAHIAYRYSAYDLKIRAGEWDMKTTKEFFDSQERVVQEIYVHQNFNDKNLNNNIALLHLAKPVDLAEHINIICMPEQDEVFDNHKNCVANGWGKNKFEGEYAVFLKKVEIDMVPHSRCNQLLKRTRLGRYFNLHDSFLCAGGEDGKDTCQGDGGAPLACPIGKNRYKLTGLVSWGISCGQQDIPAVYTNVPKFRQWVDAKMEEWGFGVTTY